MVQSGNDDGDPGWLIKFVGIPLMAVFIWLPVYLFALVRSLPIFPEMAPEFRKKMRDILP